MKGSRKFITTRADLNQNGEYSRAPKTLKSHPGWLVASTFPTDLCDSSSYFPLLSTITATRVCLVIPEEMLEKSRGVASCSSGLFHILISPVSPGFVGSLCGRSYEKEGEK